MTFIGAVNQYLPPGFSTSVGWALPNTIRIKPITHKAARYVPPLKPYDFAMVEGSLLIVNPSDKIIAESDLGPLTLPLNDNVGFPLLDRSPFAYSNSSRRSSALSSVLVLP